MNKIRYRRRDFLKAAGLGTAALVAPHVVFGRDDPAARKPPNFIIIFTDDQGYQDMGCFGSPDIKTPNLDRMAAEGMKFTDFYVVAPVCSPSRAGLMTGCYPPRVSIPGVLFPGSRIGLNPKEVTIADILKKRGYATACVGKWHLGHLPPFLPTRHGFDSYYGIPYSNDMTIARGMTAADDAKLGRGLTAETLKTAKPARHQVPLMRNEKVAEYPTDQATLTKRYTEEAVRFITANKDRPFFLYLPHTMPHVPLFASAKFRGKSKRGLYGDVIEEIDWSVGEILKALKKAGVDDNTLAVFTSDNGPWLSKGRRGGSALPLRSGKGTTYEGGVREPTLMRWPGRIPAGKACSEVAATIDLLPTIAALAGGKVPADRVIDGRDIRPLLFAKPGAKSPHEAFYYYRGNNLEAVRSGKWKLRIGRPRRRRQKDKKAEAPKAPTDELYDLQADIGEKKNLAAQHPQIVKRLKKMMQEFDKELKARARPPGKLPAEAARKRKPSS